MQVGCEILDSFQNYARPLHCDKNENIKYKLKNNTTMKKIFIAAALLLAGISTAFAGNDRPITLDKLPAAAQTFLKSHFAELTLAYAVEDPKFIGSEYEVIYTDRTEVEFDSDGAWTSVGSRYAAVPADIVPEQIKSYVAQTFPNQQVRKIERKRYSWEVELSNGLEIEFDKQFNVTDIDD